MIPQVSLAAEWTPELRETLERAALGDFIKSRRWFGADLQDKNDLSISALIELGAGWSDPRLLVASVANQEWYLIPVQFAAGPSAQGILASAPEAVIAQLNGGAIVYDALWNPVFRDWVLQFIATADSKKLSHGYLGATREGEPLQVQLGSTLVNADHTNSAVVFGNRYFFKLYRKIEAGPHPEVVLSRHLSGPGGFGHTPALAGSIQMEDSSGVWTLGALFGFVENQGDAWLQVQDRLGRYLAGPASKGSELPWLESARALGRVTGGFHRAFEQAGTEPVTQEWLRALDQRLQSAAVASLARLKGAMEGLEVSARVLAGRILENEHRLKALLQGVLECRGDFARIWIHGDYHLGQVLTTAGDFAIIDLEGEPRRPQVERLEKRCALVDVAGMLRSFHYAASAAVCSHGSVFTPKARLWMQAASEQFMSGYTETVEGATFMPGNLGDFTRLLGVFLVEKALYEVDYERRYRPDMVVVPLEGLCDLLER